MDQQPASKKPGPRKTEKSAPGFIIPAIDVIDGKCVRLTQGDYTQKKIYNEFPLEVARQFVDAGLHRLHLVDLDGAKAGKVKNWKVLEQIAGKTKLRIDFGGGIKTSQDMDIVLNSGAVWASVGSVAVKDEMAFRQWILRYGSERFLLGADVKDELIMVSGWTEATDIPVNEFIRKWMDQKITRIFCTDISRDGLLQGVALELYKRILTAFPDLQLIASGGVSSAADVGSLQEIGCYGVIIGKAIYEGRVTLKELSKFEYGLA